MIFIVCPGSREDAAVVVESAIIRSCGQGVVFPATIAEVSHWLKKPARACWVFIDPLESWSNVIIKALYTKNVKIIILGSMPTSLAATLGAVSAPLDEELIRCAKCAPAKTHEFSESHARINYHKAVYAECPIVSRPLTRFDFEDEWNNMGYGAIPADESIWGINKKVQIPEQYVIADISINGRHSTDYCGLWNMPESSIFWFNRPVGPVDSQEWRLIENYLAHHRKNELFCWPIISEIPFGFDGAVTMRLDCDEDVQSARNLLQNYRKWDIPLSIAMHTALISDRKNHMLPKAVIECGGAVLSHTATHAANWGGSYEAAFDEAIRSASSVANLTGHPVRYAVSPFHQTPRYARAALADAGYEGCIGGIIRNDPDFLMARGGIPPGSNIGFIGHTQQCMLHGDCMIKTGDPLTIYKKAFKQAMAGRAFFGYLDHPFSERYQYGWHSDEKRTAIHKEFIAFMQGSGNLLFCNEDDAMDFLRYKTAVSVSSQDGMLEIIPPIGEYSKWPVTVEYKEKVYCLSADSLMLQSISPYQV